MQTLDYPTEWWHWSHPEVVSAAGRGRGLDYPTEGWHWCYGDRYWAVRSGEATACYGPAAASTGRARPQRLPGAHSSTRISWSSGPVATPTEGGLEVPVCSGCDEEPAIQSLRGEHATIEERIGAVASAVEHGSPDKVQAAVANLASVFALQLEMWWSKPAQDRPPTSASPNPVERSSLAGVEQTVQRLVQDATDIVERAVDMQSDG